MATYNQYSPFDNTTQPGLFDFRSQQDILDQKAAQNKAETMKLVESVRPATPADRTAGMLGGLIGSAIANKFNPPVLSDAEKQATSAVQLAQDRIAAWKQNNPDATSEDLGLNTQKIMSEEFLKQGNYQQGIPLAQMYLQQANARRMADEEYRKLSGENRKADEEWNIFKVKETMQKVIINGETTPREVFVDKDGNANYTNDTGQMVQQPLGQWFHAADNYKESTGGKFNPAQYGYTPTQIGKVRDMAASVANTAGMYGRMADALSESAKATGKIDFLGKNGETQSWLTDTFNAVTGLARMAGSYLGIGADNKTFTSAQSAQDYVNSHPEIEKAMAAQNPEFARRTASERARWLAAAAQMAYARHQSLEPGSHGMSDKDFQTEMLTVGAQLSDPEAFRRLSMENFKSQLDNYQFAYENAPPEIQRLMLSDKSKARLDAAVADFDKRYNQQGFGSAQNPGPGLTGADVVDQILGSKPK